MSLSHPRGDSSDLSSAPGDPNPHRCFPWGLGWCFCLPSSRRESMATVVTVSPPCWAGSVGTGEQELEQFGKKAGSGCQRKNLKKKKKIKKKEKGGRERSSFTFCSCDSSVQANVVGGGKGKKAEIQAGDGGRNVALEGKKTPRGSGAKTSQPPFEIHLPALTLGSTRHWGNFHLSRGGR